MAVYITSAIRTFVNKSILRIFSGDTDLTGHK